MHEIDREDNKYKTNFEIILVIMVKTKYNRTIMEIMVKTTNNQ